MDFIRQAAQNSWQDLINNLRSFGGNIELEDRRDREARYLEKSLGRPQQRIPETKPTFMGNRI